MNKKTAPLFSLILTSLLIVPSLNLSVPAVASTIEEEECLPAVLLLRGSGEDRINILDRGYPLDAPSDQKLLYTGGFEGQTIARLLDSFVSETDPTKTLNKVRFIDIEYPATPLPWDVTMVPNTDFMDPLNMVSQFGANALTYHDSYTTGASKILDVIKDDLTPDENGKFCDTKYMLVGYSQGVMSVRLAVELLGNTNKIAMTYAIGDPYQQANGAFSPRHKSTANTSFTTTGVGPEILDFALTELGPPFVPILLPLAAYTAKFQAANYTMYKDYTDYDITSRSLCHSYDPTCSYSGGSIDATQHLNYFLAGSTSGDNDLEYEVEEFDKQIQTLANLSSGDILGERELKSTPGILGKTKFYNISEVRVHDTCWWDENSDGIIEKAGIPCLDGYETGNIQSENTSMKVKVLNSVGIEYEFTSDEINFDSIKFNKLMNLDPNSWYQIKPLNSPNQCLTVAQNDNVTVNDAYVAGGNTKGISLSSCENPEPNGFSQSSAVAKQSFKPARGNYNYSQGKYDTRHFLWGYDKDYYLDWNFLSTAPKLTKFNTSYLTSHTIVPKLVKIENGIPYFSFAQRYTSQPEAEERCLQKEVNEDFSFDYQCDENSDQLFSVSEVIPDETLIDNFGHLSIDGDISGPDAVIDLSVISINRNSAELSWSPVQDQRNSVPNYSIYKIVGNQDSPDDLYFDDEIISNTSSNSIIIDLSDTAIYDLNNIYVRTLEQQPNNWTNSFPIWFLTPSDIFIPSKPVLTQEPGKVRLQIVEEENLPYHPQGSSYIFYRNGVEVPIYQDEIGYWDSNIAANETYDYSYKIRLSDSSYTFESASARIMVAPIYLQKPYTSQLNMTSTEISFEINSSHNSDVFYEVYKDGNYIQTVYSYSNIFYDSVLLPGTSYTYTVIAHDYNGNQSEESEPLIVTTLSDTEAPTQPVLTMDYVNDTSLGFSIESFDNIEVTTYDIYRDGILVDTIPYPVFDDYGLTPNTLYEYSVIARDEAGNESVLSNILNIETTSSQISIVPAPTELTNYYLTADVIALKWNVTEPWNIANYSIYRNGVEIATSHTANFYIDRNIEPETSYTYSIKSKNWAGTESSPTFIVLLTPEIETIDILAPSDFNFTYLYYSNGKIFLMWTESVDSSDVTYSIYRDNVLLGTTSDLTYEDSDVLENENYVYTVTAQDVTGNIKQINSSQEVSTSPNSGGMG